MRFDAETQDVLLLTQNGIGRHVRCRGFDPHRPVIRRAWMKLGRTGRVEIDAVVHHRVDRPAQCGVPPFARHLGDRAKCVGNDAQYVHTVPGGTLGREVLDDLLRCSAVPRLGTVCCGDRCAQRLGRHAEFPCLGSPPRPQIRDTVACLVPTGIGGGLAANGRSLDARRVAALALPKVDELVGNRLFYLDGPLREPVKERLGNALDLSLAVDDVAERHAEPIREFGPKHALVQSAKGPLVALQQASIEGAPVTVIGLRLAGDHDVRVQLRIIGATRGLPKRGDRQADGLRMKPPTVVTNSRGGAESLDFAHHGFDRYVMALRESIVAGERPPCREGFRCRQGRVKTGDGANDRAVVFTRSTSGCPSGVPSIGSRPLSRASRCSVVTSPLKPKACACCPIHFPGSSPSARVR